MKVLATVALFCSWLAGCASINASGSDASERRVPFKCSNGEDVEMRFFPAQGVAVLVRDGKTFELQQQPAASGFHYAMGPHAVRGKGTEITIEVGRMAPLTCQAR